MRCRCCTGTDFPARISRHIFDEGIAAQSGLVGEEVIGTAPVYQALFEDDPRHTRGIASAEHLGFCAKTRIFQDVVKGDIDLLACCGHPGEGNLTAQPATGLGYNINHDFHKGCTGSRSGRKRVSKTPVFDAHGAPTAATMR